MTPLQAQDYVTSTGTLSDTDFYRLVACAAPPGGPCAKPFLRWQKSEITVGIIHHSPPFLGGKLKRAEASIIRALQRLNAVDMGLRLTQSDAPDITIHLLDTARGAAITNSGSHLLEGHPLVNALTALDVSGSRIKNAAIGFSRDMPIRQYESVMLEEITQALGLITDIENSNYNAHSIFSQSADNSLKTLGDQDTMALIRHYPPH